MSEEITMAYRQAGVPVQYLTSSLKKMGDPAVDLRLHVTTPAFINGLRDGKGVLLRGDPARCEEAVYCLTKSAMARHMDCYIGELTDLLTAQDADHPMWQMQVLVLPLLDNPFYATNPLLPREAYVIETAIVSWLKRGRAIIAHTSTGEHAWWSPFFTRWLVNNTQEFYL